MQPVSPWYLLIVHMLTCFQYNTLNTNLLYLYMGTGDHTTEPAEIKKRLNTGLLFSYLFIIS